MSSSAIKAASPPFAAMQQAIRAAGVTQPVIVIDKPRLLANIDQVASRLPDDMALRLVAKSLPCPELIALACDRLGTQRLMTFNLPMLEALASRGPDTDQLLGKPFPVVAAASFIQQYPQHVGRVHWLIDTPERLAQYADVAAQRAGQGTAPLNMALELDIGLHRGGFAPGQALGEALQTIRQSAHLRLTAVMGYEAHVAKVPNVFGWRRRVFARSQAAYQASLAQIAECWDADFAAGLIRNAGGSPTFSLYSDTRTANELALGSVLLKPGDFDTDLLGAYQPAAFIATPALKIMHPVRTPVLERLDPLRRAFGRRHAVCIHGGYWKATPVHPSGLRYDSSFGRSSNQEVLISARAPELEPDDFVFLQPTQSEAVLSQLGPLAVFDGEQISETWPVLPPRG